MFFLKELCDEWNPRSHEEALTELERIFTMEQESKATENKTVDEFRKM